MASKEHLVSTHFPLFALHVMKVRLVVLHVNLTLFNVLPTCICYKNARYCLVTLLPAQVSGKNCFYFANKQTFFNSYLFCQHRYLVNDFLVLFASQHSF